MRRENQNNTHIGEERGYPATPAPPSAKSHALLNSLSSPPTTFTVATLQISNGESHSPDLRDIQTGGFSARAHEAEGFQWCDGDRQRFRSGSITAMDL